MKVPDLCSLFPAAFTTIASLLGFLAMCCQSQSLLILVIFLFIVLAGIEIAVCVLSLYTNAHARAFLNHLWAISSRDFRLYIEVRVLLTDQPILTLFIV